MKTKNFLILLAITSVVLFIILGNAKSIVYKILHIETDDEKIVRLKINNKQQKQALEEKEKEEKISNLTSKVELNTTMSKDASVSKLTNRITALKTNIKLDTNKTKILNHIEKELKINLVRTIKHKDKSIDSNKVKTEVTHYHKRHKVVRDTKPIDNRKKIVVERSTYLIYGYKDIKAIYAAYEAVKEINKKDKK